MQGVSLHDLHFYPAVRAFRRGGRSYFVNTYTGTWAVLSLRHTKAIAEGLVNNESHEDFHKAYEALAKARIVRDQRFSEEKRSTEIKALLVKLQITGKCNFRCVYCFNDTDIRTDTMKPETMRAAVDYAFTNPYAANGLIFTIYGGEPLMERGLLYDTIAYIREKGGTNTDAYINIITNGSLLTDEDVTFLKKHKVKVSISFDGIPDFQDRNRPDINGRATSEVTIRGLKLLADCSDVCVLATVTREMSAHLLDIALYLEKLGVSSVEFLPLRMLGCAEGRGDIAANAVAYTQSLKKIVDAIENGHISRISVRTILRMLLPLETGQTLHGELGEKRCGSGRNVISINYDGSITGCDMMPSAFRPIIGDVWKGITDIESLDRLLVPYGKVSSFCNRCPWMLFCRSGCTGASGSDGKTCNSRHLLSCAINKEIYPYLLEKLVTDGGVLHSYFQAHTTRKSEHV